LVAVHVQHVLGADVTTIASHTQAQEHVMYSRVTTFQIQPGTSEESLRTIESLTPQMRDVKGLVSFQLLMDRTANSGMVVTLYESLADLEAGATLLQQTVANPSVAALMAGPPTIAVYEVALQVAAQP
jgi:heme-degrading monooxygenase HmoA